MIKHTLHARSIAAGLSLFASSLLLGQTASPTAADVSERNPAVTRPPGTPARNNDEPVKLSPFVVSSERDVGFAAASSLAGGRLAGDLKDTAAAYSVINREFIDALGIVDISEAANWTVNTTALKDDGQNQMFGAPIPLSIRGGNVGQANNGLQRDYFRLMLNYDSYNIERYDYARGPNAVLFGSGDYVGTATALTRKARIDKNFGEVAGTYGSWDNRRTTLDLNRVLIQDVLALRLDGVLQERNSWRDYEWETKKMATLDAVWNVTKTTELRVQGERGYNEKATPLTSLGDRFSGWDGKSTFASLITDAQLNANGNAQGFERLGNGIFPLFSYSPSVGAIDRSGTAITKAGNANGATPVGGQLVVGPGINMTGNPFMETVNLPGGLYNAAIAGSNFSMPGRGFGISHDDPTFIEDFKVFSAFLNQRVGERLFVEVAANYSNRETLMNWMIRDLRNVYIDINEKLPDGQANPHFRDAYGEGNSPTWIWTGINKSARASVAYLLENTRLGDFSFTGSWDYVDSLSEFRYRSYVVKGLPTLVDGVTQSRDPRFWGNDRLRYRYYFNDTSRPLAEPGSVNYQGRTYQAGWITDLQSNAGGNDGYFTDNALQVAAKAKLLKGRLHLLAAARQDRYTGGTRSGLNPGDYPTGWDAQTLYFRREAPADWATLTYIPKDASGNPTGGPRPALSRPRGGTLSVPLAQYANDRFQDDYSPPQSKLTQTSYTVGAVGYLTKDVIAFANYSTSFNPQIGRVLIDGRAVDPYLGKGWDVGVRHVLAGGKLSTSLSYYQGTQENMNFNQNTPTGQINAIVQASPAGTDPSRPPAAGQGNTLGYAPLTGNYDYAQGFSRGWEFELVANPTKNWRVNFNAARAESYQEDAYSVSLPYLAANEAELIRVVTATGVIVDPTTKVATVNTSIPAALRPDAANVAANWNTLMSNRANWVTGRQMSRFVPKYSVNLFTDYKFAEGGLKGFRVGGGVNWRGKQAIGFRGADTIVDPSNPALAIDDPSVDAYTPVYIDGYYLATLVFGYEFKLADRYPIQIDFNIRNLLNNQDPQYVGTVMRPTGGNISQPARVATPAHYYYFEPTSYSVSVGLKF